MSAAAGRAARGAARTVRIGITGPIGCGKSTVAGWVAEAGATVVDADIVAREVVEPGEPALEAVFRAFGNAVRAPDGTLDRRALGRIVFTDPGSLARLEAIVHPAVRPRIVAAMERAEAGEAPAVVVEAIKLVEGGLAGLCDEVWFVRCDPGEQHDRLAERGLDPADATTRISAQAGLEARLRPAATRIVDTSGSRDEARTRVLQAYEDALAARRAASGGG